MSSEDRAGCMPPLTQITTLADGALSREMPGVERPASRETVAGPGNGKRGKQLRAWLIVFSLSVIVGVSFQGSRGIYETSEGRYAECAREMLTSRAFLEPTLGYRAHWTKPPLIYWMLTLGMEAFGVNAWGVRLPNAFAFALTALLVMGLAGKLFDEKTGMAAGLVYATSPLPVFAANSLTADTFLALWEVAAVFCYVAAWKTARGGRNHPWVIGMWFMFGVGFLTKGPPALLPLLAIILWSRLCRRGPRIVSPLGLLLFLLTAFSWFVWEALKHPGLCSYWLGTEVVGRLSSSSVHNSEWYKGFRVLLLPLAVGLGVWILPLIRRVHTRRLLHLHVLKRAIVSDYRFAFLFLWLAVPVGVCLLARSKLPLYVLPFFAPLAIAAGHSLQAVDRRRFGRRPLIIAVLTAVALISVKGVLAYADSKRDMRKVADLCLQLKDGSAEIYTWDRSKLYGLQFYLNGNLKRTSVSGSEPWADAAITNVLDALNEEKPGILTIFIGDQTHRKTIADTLQSRGIHYESTSNRYWSIYAIPPLTQEVKGSGVEGR